MFETTTQYIYIYIRNSYSQPVGISHPSLESTDGIGSSRAVACQADQGNQRMVKEIRLSRHGPVEHVNGTNCGFKKKWPENMANFEKS